MSYPSIPRKRFKGFTLAELLISLLILAEIATFTIPKILNAQQAGGNNAKAKEVAGMISGAYQQAQFAGLVTQNTKPSDLTPYMNYVALDTSGTQVDSRPGQGAATCNATSPCIREERFGSGALILMVPPRLTLSRWCTILMGFIVAQQRMAQAKGLHFSFITMDF